MFFFFFSPSQQELQIENVKSTTLNTRRAAALTDISQSAHKIGLIVRSGRKKMGANVLQTKTKCSCQDEGCQSPEKPRLNL